MSSESEEGRLLSEVELNNNIIRICVSLSGLLRRVKLFTDVPLVSAFSLELYP